MTHNFPLGNTGSHVPTLRISMQTSFLAVQLLGTKKDETVRIPIQRHRANGEAMSSENFVVARCVFKILRTGITVLKRNVSFSF